ncbi:MAG TPA: S41 family peptidase [Candidatus Acidoferrales bacterium]|nr:S41 family peptidase [Candidatus Acidoferrales bacterium]
MNIRLLGAFTASALLGSLLAPLSLPAAPLTSIDNNELETSYELVTAEFYKKVDPQALLDGARNGLIGYLKLNGVSAPALPAVHATDDDGQNVRTLEREVDDATTTYGAKLSTRELTYSAISGMLNSVHDRYTVFLSPKDYAALNEGLDGGNFSGVGIAIHVDDDTKYLSVSDVIPDGPAEKAGIKPGDIITSVDGKTTKGLTTEDDAKMLRGKEGTTVHIEIERDGKPLAEPITVVRAVIHEPSVYARLLDNGIGYTRLTVFGSTTATELTDALNKLEAEGAKAYILDLRDNGGGYLNTAIDVSSKFIPSGAIVSVESRSGTNTEYDAEDVAIPSKPLAVLVNEYTASASEITSGAIQDNGVGELVGERTFGKGVVQTIHPLPDGSAVKITTARYFTPRGRDINMVGIQPDIVSPDPKKAILGDLNTDTQMQAAVSYLERRLAQISTSASN